MDLAIGLGILALLVLPAGGVILFYLLTRNSSTDGRPEPPQTNRAGRTIPGKGSRKSE